MAVTKEDLKKVESSIENSVGAQIGTLITLITKNSDKISEVTLAHIEKMGDLTCKLEVFVSESVSFRRDMEKQEKNQIKDGKRIAHIEKDHGKRIAVIEAQRDGVWKMRTFLCVAITALATLFLVLKSLT